MIQSHKLQDEPGTRRAGLLDEAYHCTKFALSSSAPCATTMPFRISYLPFNTSSHRYFLSRAKPSKFHCVSIAYFSRFTVSEEFGGDRGNSGGLDTSGKLKSHIISSLSFLQISSISSLKAGVKPSQSGFVFA